MSEWKEHDGGSQPEETKGKVVQYMYVGESRQFENDSRVPTWSQVRRYRISPNKLPDLLTVLELIEVDLTAGDMPAKTRVALALDRVRAALAARKEK